MGKCKDCLHYEENYCILDKEIGYCHLCDTCVEEEDSCGEWENKEEYHE